MPWKQITCIYLQNTIPPACSIHQRPRINTIAPLDQFQRIQISAELKQWLLKTIRHYSHYLLFAICHYSLFATIRYSGFPDTPVLYCRVNWVFVKAKFHCVEDVSKLVTYSKVHITVWICPSTCASCTRHFIRFLSKDKTYRKRNYFFQTHSCQLITQKYSHKQIIKT